MKEAVSIFNQYIKGSAARRVTTRCVVMHCSEVDINVDLYQDQQGFLTSLNQITINIMYIFELNYE
jgi:hypothetical protein